MENELFTFISRYMILTEEEKKTITELNIFRSFKKDSILLHEGEISMSSYFVLKGCLRSYHIVDGEERTTAFYTEGESLTPVCVVTEKPSDYYIDCLEDVTVLVADPCTEQNALERFPRFESLTRVLTEELLANSPVSFTDFQHTSPEQRYADLIRTRPDLLHRVPFHQLASYLGISTESLSDIHISREADPDPSFQISPA